ncbi:MAG: hypothetical protein IKM48_00595 [Clostridia bacterium]|nr:hypothetical protein [Clostridia bacterium]
MNFLVWFIPAVLLFAVALVAGACVDFYAQKWHIPNLGPIVAIAIVGAAIMGLLMFLSLHI